MLRGQREDAAGPPVTKIKICGLTRAEDVAACVELGAAYLGFNFSTRSARRVDPRAVKALREAAQGACRVGIFVDEGPEEIRTAIGAMGLDVLQMHRDLAAADFAHGLPVIAVSRVAGGAARVPEPELLERCHALLFDTSHPGGPGGTGVPFDWSILHGRKLPVPVGLAGGLRPDNVGSAIRAVRPDIVDVASGVESAPGVKDPRKLAAFFEAVHGA